MLASLCCARYFRPAQLREENPDQSTLPWPPRPVGPEAHAENKELAKAEAACIRQKRRKAKFEVLFALIGYSVGLASAWRFPYFAYRNGGGAFLFAFFLLSIFVGLPVVFLEISLGQYSSLSQVKVWRLCPIARGIGYAGVLVGIFRFFYAPALIAWSVFYLYGSFNSELPWASCDNFWNTPSCSVRPKMNGSHIYTYNPGINKVSPADEFWEHRLLMQSSGIEVLGTLRWELFLITIMLWFITALSVSNGIKSLGKVVYFTAIFPFIALLVLVIRGVTLPGAVEGIKFLLVPDWKALGNTRLWTDAVLHLVYSFGIASGPYFNLGSYNKFHNNCQRDAIIIVVANLISSLLAGIAVFSVLGFLSHELGLSLPEVTKSGPGLPFVSFSTGLTKMPLAPVWAVIFFLMLFTLGIDTMFGIINSIVSVIIEDIPKLKPKRWMVAAVFCIIAWASGIIVSMQSGVYWVNLLEWHCGGYTLIIVLLLEIITVMYTYGYPRFADDIYTMLGHYPNWFWVISWNIVAPITILGVLIAKIIGHEPAFFDNYDYPLWAEMFGWAIAIITLSAIPIAAFYVIFKKMTTKGWGFRDLVRPDPKWGPALNVHRHERGLPPIEQVLQNPLDLTNGDLYNYIPQEGVTQADKGKKKKRKSKNREEEFLEGFHLNTAANYAPASDSQTPDQPPSALDYDDSGQTRFTYSHPPSYHTQAENRSPNLYPTLDPGNDVPTEVLMQQSPLTEFKIVETPNALNQRSNPQAQQNQQPLNLPQMQPQQLQLNPQQLQPQQIQLQPQQLQPQMEPHQVIAQQQPVAATIPNEGLMSIPINLQITLTPSQSQQPQQVKVSQAQQPVVIQTQPQPQIVAQPQQPVVSQPQPQVVVQPPKPQVVSPQVTVQQTSKPEPVIPPLGGAQPATIPGFTLLSKAPPLPPIELPQLTQQTTWQQADGNPLSIPTNQTGTPHFVSLPPTVTLNPNAVPPAPMAPQPPSSFTDFATVQHYSRYDHYTGAEIQTVPTRCTTFTTDPVVPPVNLGTSMVPVYNSNNSLSANIPRNFGNFSNGNLPRGVFGTTFY